MTYKIERAAVLGAGTMGAAIAAHLANAGIPSLLLDVVPSELTEEEKRQGLGLDHPQGGTRVAPPGGSGGPSRAAASAPTPPALPPAGSPKAARRISGPTSWVPTSSTRPATSSCWS